MFLPLALAALTLIWLNHHLCVNTTDIGEDSNPMKFDLGEGTVSFSPRPLGQHVDICKYIEPCYDTHFAQVFCCSSTTSWPPQHRREITSRREAIPGRACFSSHPAFASCRGSWSRVSILPVVPRIMTSSFDQAPVAQRPDSSASSQPFEDKSTSVLWQIRALRWLRIRMLLGAKRYRIK